MVATATVSQPGPLCLLSEEASSLPQVNWAWWGTVSSTSTKLSLKWSVHLPFKLNKLLKKIILIKLTCTTCSNCRCFRKMMRHPARPRMRFRSFKKAKRKTSLSLRSTWDASHGRETLTAFSIMSPKTLPRRTSKPRQVERSWGSTTM